MRLRLQEQLDSLGSVLYQTISAHIETVETNLFRATVKAGVFVQTTTVRKQRRFQMSPAVVVNVVDVSVRPEEGDEWRPEEKMCSVCSYPRSDRDATAAVGSTAPLNNRAQDYSDVIGR